MSARRSLTVQAPWEEAGRPWRWVAVDAAVLLVLAALVAVAFHPVYGTSLLFLSVVGFAAAGIGVALLSALRRWRVGSTVLAAIMVWFVLGTPLTMPSAGIGAVVPTGRSLLGLLVGPVTAWRDMLTLDPPIGETWNLLTAPGLVGYLVGLVGCAITLRSRRPAAAWVPAGVGYAVGAALGARVALWPLWLGLVAFVVVLVWVTHRRNVLRDRLSVTRGSLRPARAAMGAGMLVVAGLVGALVAPAVVGSGERTTLRSAVEIPVDLAEYRSPLQGYRANITKHRTETLFEVAGARPGDVVRLATLDGYDGIAFRVSTLDDEAVEETTFRRVGEWIDDDTVGDELDLRLRVEGYEGVWVPTVGRSTQVAFDGERAVELGETFFYNHGSGTGVTLAGLREGDTYTLAAVVPARPSDASIAAASAGQVTLPKIEGSPETLRTLARQWTEGAATDGARLLELEARLQQGYFSHGQPDEVESLPGHSQSRLLGLLEDTDRMVGDDEQYASTMTLMARELGIPARVIYGFEVGDSPSITGDEVGAWTEVNLDGLGWVRFDPTPDEDRTADDIDPPEPPKPLPYVVNPPPPPQKPDVPPPDEQLPIQVGEPPEPGTEIDWAQVGAVVLLTGIPLLTIVVPVALIIGLKLRRRARRRNDPVVANRVAGAWLELVDKARDLGRSPSLSATRSEQATQLTEDFPRVAEQADAVALAKEADWLVFAPGDPAEVVARDYWAESGNVRRGMRRSVRWPRWLASGLSTKSFRRMRTRGGA